MPVARIPFSWPYAERGNSTAKDSRRVNVMDEKSGDTVYTVKRPGTTTAYSSITPGVGQGLTKYNGMIYAITDDKFQSVTAAPNSGTDGSAWTNLGSASWSPRWGFQAQALNDTIYIMGGVATTDEIVSGDVWALGIKTGWKQCTGAAPWAGRLFFGSAILNGRIYVMGGYTQTVPATTATVFNDVWSTTNGSDWRLEGTVSEWSPRYGASVISTGTGIYIMGGTDISGAVLNDVWYSVDGKSWSQVTDSAGWAGRTYAQAYWYKNQVFIAGGANAGGSGFRDVWSSYDGKTWSQLTTTAWPSGRFLAGYAVYGNKMWLVNGSNSLGSDHNDVYSSTDGATWTSVTASGPFGASDAGALVVAPSPTDASPYNYQTLYWLGGETSLAVPTSNVYYGNINAAVISSTTLPVTTAQQPFQFSTFKNGTLLVFKNQADMFVLQSQHVIRVADTGYPTVTVPGLVELDARLYVMDPTGLIRNSAINDPFTWPLLNAVGADFEDDLGVALAKYMNYVVAFGTYTIQVFYDGGGAIGSPLVPYLNAALKIGCASADTLAYFGPNMAWVSQTKELNRQVMMMEGLTPKVISTPFIEKLIKDATLGDMKAVLFSVPGHLFYVLQYAPSSSSLVFDFTTQDWYEWTDANDVAYMFAATIGVIDSSPGLTLALDSLFGTIYNITPAANSDVLGNFTVTIITRKVDLGNNDRKFWHDLTIIGDRTTGTMDLSWTDDDYQTYNTPRTITLDAQQPKINRCGNGRRRAFKATKTDNNAMRLEALEATLTQGQG